MLANPSMRLNSLLTSTKHVKLPEPQSAAHIEDISLEDLHLHPATQPSPPKDYHKIYHRNRTTSPLLVLPRELRDQIITQTLLTHPHPLNATSTSLPSLLQTSTQLRHETAQLYYLSTLLLAGGTPSPHYEKTFFDGFDPQHLRFVRRVHWLYESFGTRGDAMRRAGELDGLSGVGRKGVWTVGFIEVAEVGERGVGRGRVVYVNCFGEVVPPAEF